MLMTVKDFVEKWADDMQDDIDVYDDVCEEIAIAYCGGYSLTDEGKEHFKEVLTYNIEVVEPDFKQYIPYPYAIIKVDDEEGVWQKKLKKAKEFFFAAAGYCACDDYDKWFEEVN